MNIYPIRFIIIGGILVLFGFLASFVNVLRVVEATFWLSFLSYGGSVVGLLLAIIGGVEYNSRRNNWD